MASAPTQNKRTVLIPIDNSDDCMRAFDWYTKNLHKPGDLHIFVHVVEPVCSVPVATLGYGIQTPIIIPDLSQVMSDILERSKKMGHDYINKAKALGIDSKAFLYVHHQPGQAIVSAIKDHEAEMVVMGNRGLGTIRRTFLGSVTDYVMHHACVPVVVVPPASSVSSAEQDREQQTH